MYKCFHHKCVIICFRENLALNGHTLESLIEMDRASSCSSSSSLLGASQRRHCCRRRRRCHFYGMDILPSTKCGILRGRGSTDEYLELGDIFRNSHTIQNHEYHKERRQRRHRHEILLFFFFFMRDVVFFV